MNKPTLKEQLIEALYWFGRYECTVWQYSTSDIIQSPEYNKAKNSLVSAKEALDELEHKYPYLPLH